MNGTEIENLVYTYLTKKIVLKIAPMLPSNPLLLGWIIGKLD